MNKTADKVMCDKCKVIKKCVERAMKGNGQCLHTKKEPAVKK